MGPILNISPEGVRRVLLAVGNKFVPLETYPVEAHPAHRYPGPNGNRSIDLAARLDASVLNYYAALDSRGDKQIKTKIARSETVMKTGAKLRKLLQMDDNPRAQDENDRLLRQIEALRRRTISEVDLLKVLLNDPLLIGAAKWEALKPIFRLRSPFEWLAGTYLPDDFWNFYGKKATLQRGMDGAVGGPYVRFVRQVLVEFKITNSGEPFSDEGIARALTDARKGRFRAKNSEKELPDGQLGKSEK